MDWIGAWIYAGTEIDRSHKRLDKIDKEDLERDITLKNLTNDIQSAKDMRHDIIKLEERFMKNLTPTKANVDYLARSTARIAISAADMVLKTKISYERLFEYDGPSFAIFSF